MYIYITLGCCCHVVMVHLIKDISCIIQHCSIPQFLIIQLPLYTFPVLCNSFFCCFLFTDCGKQFIFESHSSPRCSFNPVHYFTVCWSCFLFLDSKLLRFSFVFGVLQRTSTSTLTGLYWSRQPGTRIWWFGHPPVIVSSIAFISTY